MKIGRRRMSEFEDMQKWKNHLVEKLKDARDSLVYRFTITDTRCALLSMQLGDGESSTTSLSDPSTQTKNKRKIDQTDMSLQDEEAKRLKPLSESCGDECLCGVCKNILVEPRALECGHSSCKFCLYEWLKEEKTCPICKEKLYEASHPNRNLEEILNSYIRLAGKSDEYENRKKEIQIKFDEDLAKLCAMIESAKAKKTHLFNIKEPWKSCEKNMFMNSIRKHFGKCREEYCKLFGLTKEFCNACSSEELVIACDNLDIPLEHKIVGEGVDTMRRIVDHDSSRVKLLSFWNASDNLFI